MSLFTGVGAISSSPQPTSTFHEGEPTTGFLDASQDVHMSSSYHHASAVQTPLWDFSTQAAPTALPQPTTDSTQSTKEVPPSHDPPQDSNSMSTIIAGLAALILLLATVAGCTIIGCLGYVYCKSKPPKFGSSEDKDEKDTFSLKDISPTSSLSELNVVTATQLFVNVSMDAGLWQLVPSAAAYALVDAVDVKNLKHVMKEIPS